MNCFAAGFHIAFHESPQVPVYNIFERYGMEYLKTSKALMCLPFPASTVVFIFKLCKEKNHVYLESLSVLCLQQVSVRN